MSETFDENAAAEALERFGKAVTLLGKAINQFGMDMVQAFEQVNRDLKPALMKLYDDEPWPGEHPVDYVLRVGARSGFYIYPDEAWRYRANLDWWHDGRPEMDHD